MAAIDKIVGNIAETQARLKGFVEEYRAAEAELEALHAAIDEAKLARDGLAQKIAIERSELMKIAQADADVILKNALDAAAGIMAKAEAQVKEARAEIDKLHEALNRLEAQRADRQAYVDALNQAIKNSPQLRHK